MRILVLCTGNHCRSQMAEGWLRKLAPDWTVCSAGINPAVEVHPLAKKVMREVGINIEGARPKSADLFLEEPWDYVITVCANAERTCPSFNGYVRNRVHMGFNDPDAFAGSEEMVIGEFRRVRDEIGQKMSAFVDCQKTF